jgi:hypothetical protein
METHTTSQPTHAEMPQPETPPVILEGELVDAGRFRATARVPREDSYMPSAEARQPEPIKLDPSEAQKRVTPGEGVRPNWRGDITITSANSKLAVQRERAKRLLVLNGNFAKQALGKAIKHIKNKKEQWDRDHVW